MLLIPAIDLKDGRCVRLRQGDLDDATVFSEDPASMATRWLEQGARRLHLVDPNGAVKGFKEGMKDANGDKPAEPIAQQRVAGETIDVQAKEKSNP